jgi:hypothetical protein
MKNLRILIITLSILLFVGKAYSADPWSKLEIWNEVAFEVINAADFYSTNRILNDHPTTAMEMNPLLGSHPSYDKLLGVAIGTAVIHPIVTHFMPKKYRPYWQYSFIIIKAGAVANNYHVDLGFHF